MTDGAGWLSTQEFAAQAGIGARPARIVLSRALNDGKPYRGRVLPVRKAPSRGGARGKAFEVRADWADAPVDAIEPAPRATIARYAIIAPALKHPRGSAERRQAMKAAAEVCGVTERSIAHWIAQYEAEGRASLSRGRTDAGKRRHVISAKWDGAVPFDDATRERIAADVERYTRSLWASTTDWGWKKIARLASTRLADLTMQAGFTGDARHVATLCKLSHRYVNRFRKYRAVATRDLDAKRWNDEHRGRIQRTRAGRLPMQVVVGDVHPIDILLPREDGSTFTAKLIGFEDWATYRLFVYPVFLEKGEGVRQEHIIQALVAMGMDPHWGMPEILYLDNGKEYSCLDLVADALKRTTQIRALNDDPAFRAGTLERAALVKAQPYNAAAKDIEGHFARLERVLSALPGWIGGNRMAKRTANVGQAAVPYGKGKDAFLADLHTAVAFLDTNPLDCFDGRTPREVFNEACAGGWKAAHYQRGALLARFARDASRTVRQGRFRFKGKPYTHRKIQELPKGTPLHLRVPIVGLQWGIPVLDEHGDLLCMADVDRPYDVLDPAGAVEAAARHAAARRGVEKLRADVDKLDMSAEIAKAVAAAEPEAMPGTLSPIRESAANEAIGRELERTPAERKAEEDEAEQISREEWRRMADAFFEKVRVA